MRYFVFLVIPMVMLNVASCDKTWTCECRDANGVSNVYQVNVKKEKKAERVCNDAALPGETCNID